MFDTNDVLPSDEDTKVVEIKSVSEIKDKLKNCKMVAMHNLNFVWNFATNENEQFVLPKNVEDDAEFCDFFQKFM